MSKIIKILLIVIIILNVIIIVAGALGGVGPFRFIQQARLSKLPGNVEQYHLYNISPKASRPLEGKTFYFLGSSVTKGEHSLDVSFADYLVKLDSIISFKEAVSGTTLVDTGKNSYISRMKNNIDSQIQMDAFVCQLSTNDATRKKPLGGISTDRDLNSFDTSTIIGAIEFIIVYAQTTWNCPVIFYTGTKYNSELYDQMVSALFELQSKYGIGIIDMWNNEQMNNVSDDDYKLYMSDKIHPTQAGYLFWWTPVIEEYLYRFL